MIHLLLYPALVTALIAAVACGAMGAAPARQPRAVPVRVHRTPLR